MGGCWQTKSGLRQSEWRCWPALHCQTMQGNVPSRLLLGLVKGRCSESSHVQTYHWWYAPRYCGTCRPQSDCLRWNQTERTLLAKHIVFPCSKAGRSSEPLRALRLQPNLYNAKELYTLRSLSPVVWRLKNVHHLHSSECPQFLTNKRRHRSSSLP